MKVKLKWKKKTFIFKKEVWAKNVDYVNEIYTDWLKYLKIGSVFILKKSEYFKPVITWNRTKQN